MAAGPALFYDNLVQSSATLITATGAQTAFSVEALRDQLLSRTWRSPLAWVIGAENNKLDFNRGGVKVATIASGTYTTGAALAIAIVAALEAADPTPVWACVYSASTHKFTISSDLAFTLLAGTGTNKANSIHADLGYASADTGSATSQVAGLVSYQSRYAINLDLGSAKDVSVGAAIGHNLGAGGITLQGSDTTLVGVGFGATGLAFSQVLTGTDVRAALISTQTRRYWRFLIDDVQNPDGFSQVGVPFVGTWVALAKFRTQPVDERDELSQIAFALDGAHFQTERPTRRGWELEFIIPDTDKVATWEPFAAAVKVGRNFFFAFTSEQSARYVYLDRGLSFRALETFDPVMWSVKLALREALG
jgi:hypothetical protein